MPIRFLDIDLDAFVEPTRYWAGPERAEEGEYNAWPEAKVRSFLEEQCGLSRDHPIPGSFMIEHDEAFDVLLSAFQQGGLIDLVHIDAHADLGLGDQGWVYMHRELLQLPVHKRAHPVRGSQGMNASNWLAFVVAAGCVSEVTFVHPEEGAHDLFALHFRNCDPKTRIIEMKRLEPSMLTDSNLNYERLTRATPLERDTPIPFNTTVIDAFSRSAPFDRGILCHSPKYTPASADVLIPIIGEYIQF